MSLLNIISQVLLYFSVSVLVGSFILLLVPNRYRPDIHFSKRLMLISAIFIPVCAFFSVLDIVLYIAPRLGLLESFTIVLTSYTVGAAWSFTLLASIFLVLLIIFTYSTEKKSFAYFGTFLTLGIILTVAWSSHAGAMQPSLGIISDFIHLLAATVWVGILLIIALFSKNNQNWLAFLDWFSIVAFGCLTATFLSGIVMSDILMDGYVKSWTISYGQGLLVKHLFLLPVLFYALINGVIVKYKLRKDDSFNPIPWVRLESFLLFIIFAVTAVYTQQSPQVSSLTNETISPLFRLFHGTIIDGVQSVGFAVNAYTACFFIIAVLFLGLMALTYKKASHLASFFFSCLFVLSAYIMLMVSVVLR